MPGKSRRRQRSRGARGPNSAPQAKSSNAPRSQRRNPPRSSWYSRNRSALKIYGIAGAVVIGIVALVAFGVQQSLSSDFTFSMYQGENELGVPRENAQFSSVFPSAKPVVLNFWAGQCPPCRAEMPAFQRVYDEFQDDFILFGLDVGPFMGLGSNRDAQDLLRELNITYPAGYAHNRDPVAQNNIVGMPTTLFMTPDGKTFEKRIGQIRESDMRTLVQNLIDASS